MICSLCKKDKPESEYYYNNKQKKHFHWCKICFQQREKIRRKQVKRKIVAYLGGKCADCGYDKCLRSLDCHHLDPNEKEFTISRYRGSCWDKIVPELDKCILLCKNCHGERHEDEDGFYLEPTGSCPNCGDDLFGTKYCSIECRGKFSRKVERPSKQELEEKIETMNWTAIGREYGVSDNAVRKWAKKFDLI